MEVLRIEWHRTSDETIAELENYFAEKIEIVEKQIAEIKHIYPSTSVGSYEKKSVKQISSGYKQL